MIVAWALFWGGSRSTKPRVFPCNVAAAGDFKVPPVRRVRLRSFQDRIGSPLVLCNVWKQIAL